MATPALELKIVAKDAEIWDMWIKWADFKRIQERITEINKAGIPAELEEEYCDMIPTYYELGVKFGFWTQEDLIEWEY